MPSNISPNSSNHRESVVSQIKSNYKMSLRTFRTSEIKRGVSEVWKTYFIVVFHFDFGFRKLVSSDKKFDTSNANDVYACSCRCRHGASLLRLQLSLSSPFGLRPAALFHVYLRSSGTSSHLIHLHLHSHTAHSVSISFLCFVISIFFSF